MNWPPIEIPVIGRSGLIALIALLHIPFFVNFVMGAPLIAVVSEWLGKRSGDTRYDRVARDISAMALVTVGIGAFGGVALVVSNIGLFPRFFSTGVGIFFWPLVLEILMFLIEAVFLALYRYTWPRLAHRNLHMLFGLLGALGAWGSGFIINGLASFMLTPGNWVETRQLLDAAFNPSFWPSFAHRGLAAFSVTGFFLVVYALWRWRRAGTAEERESVSWTLRYAGKWAVVATALQVLPGSWYLIALELGTRNAAPEGSVVPKLLGGPLTFFWFGGILLAAAAILVVWFLAVQAPQRGLKAGGRLLLILAVLFILVTNAFMGFTRERARKPYLVYGVMYGNELMAVVRQAAEGISAPEAGQPPPQAPEATREPSPSPPGELVERGEVLFRDKGCLDCHQLGGQGGDFGPPLDGVGTRQSDEQLRQFLLNPPPAMQFLHLTAAEAEALAAFLATQK
jgi:cytochrome bd-type quinol oxidase subunit 1